MNLSKNLDTVLFGDPRPRYQRDLNRAWRPSGEQSWGLIKGVVPPLRRWLYAASPISLFGAYLVIRRLTAKKGSA